MAHKHFMHLSHIMASIYMHIAIKTCNKSKVIDIILHMLMLMDAQMMLMLMNASAQCMLNTRVFQLHHHYFPTEYASSSLMRINYSSPCLHLQGWPI